MSRPPHNIAPRVTVYASGEPVPRVTPGAIALAQLDRSSDGPPVFGDGSHPTTRLCAAAVDLLCRREVQWSVLDVGTGTGILARIARARGARRVVATDIDPAALKCARAHAELDEHPVAIQFSTAGPDELGDHFALVVANILSGPLTGLARALSRALAPGGLLLLSGFTRFELPQLCVLYEKEGLRIVRSAHQDEWALVMCQR